MCIRMCSGGNDCHLIRKWFARHLSLLDSADAKEAAQSAGTRDKLCDPNGILRCMV